MVITDIAPQAKQKLLSVLANFALKLCTTYYKREMSFNTLHNLNAPLTMSRSQFTNLLCNYTKLLI